MWESNKIWRIASSETDWSYNNKATLGTALLIASLWNLKITLD